jgi:hypothetical protein
MGQNNARRDLLEIFAGKDIGKAIPKSLKAASL